MKTLIPTGYFITLLLLAGSANAQATNGADQQTPPAITDEMRQNAMPVTPPTPPAPTQPVFATLKDGTKIEMDPDGTAYSLGADGKKIPLPDGVLTLRDGVTFTMRGGKRMDE